ncbi:MAG: hypothetical protein Q4G21_07670 [Dermabacter sp.]|nr:hypothetical protein [Dermabacter sp.]
MPALHVPADEPFFREWTLHHGPLTRSRERARLLTEVVGIATDPPVPVIGVVGSKGKGSTVAALTQRLVALGHTVGTICSPPFLTNHERIRLNGVPASGADYEAIAARLDRALAALPPVEETGGYLAPTGAFTLMGADHLLRSGATVLVIEEGLGGISDEISQFRLDALVVTPVFLEHEGVIGSSVEEIAHNLVGAADHRTRRVIIPSTQGTEAREAIGHLLPHAEIIEVPSPEDFGFGPLTSMNVATGYAAALASAPHAPSAPAGRSGHTPDLDEADAPPRKADAAPSDADFAARLRLPGRSSLVCARGRTWFLDAAISAEGVRSALTSAHAVDGMASAPILVCMPDIKDVPRILAELDPERTLLVRTHEDHLSFSTYPATWPSMTLDQALEQLGSSPRVIALGTMSFMADMAHYLDLDTATWFE